jgi:hypothetical protein
MNQIYEVVDKNDKIFRHYEVTDLRTNVKSWVVAESSEQWCEIRHVHKGHYAFRQVPFFLADYNGWAKPI